MQIDPEEIRRHLRDLGMLTPQLQVGDTDSLMDAAILDSLRLTDLVMQLERTFGIRVDMEELVPDNFDTIAAISQFVAMKRQGA